MSSKVLEAIREKKERIAGFGAEVIGNKVPAILRNFSEIRGKQYARQQIYRMAGRDQGEFVRPGVMENMFDFFASTSLASRAKGELITAEVASWEDWRRSIVPAEFQARPAADFWQTEEELDALLSKLRRAHVRGDHAEAKLVLIGIRQKCEQLQWLTEIAATQGGGQHKERISAG